MPKLQMCNNLRCKLTHVGIPHMPTWIIHSDYSSLANKIIQFEYLTVVRICVKVVKLNYFII